MNYLIDQQPQLKAIEPLLDQLKQQGAMLAVDTEFFREKTYNAKLCLIQLGIGGDQYCIDVLAIDDLGCIADIFADESVTKLLHAARQDMEVIWQTLGMLPKPVFDTQVAAAFCGADLQIGHTALVLEKLGVELSKSQARTDWTRRPLSEDQLAYAAEDVAHLIDLHDLLAAELDQTGKREWFDQEIEDLYELEKYQMDPALAYQRLSGGNLKLDQQYTLKALAEWREKLAQERDIPRSWVLRDDRIYDLAIKRPIDEQVILDMNIFGRKSAPRLAPKAAKIIAHVEVGAEPLWNRADPLDRQQKKVCSDMMAQVKEAASARSIAQGLMGTRKDIEKLFRTRTSSKLLNSWRRDVVGQALLQTVENAST